MKPDGGQAFPVPASTAVTGEHYNYEKSGMSLRDYFAAQALIGLIGSDNVIKADGKKIHGESEFARAAYTFADAMLAQRDKP